MKKEERKKSEKEREDEMKEAFHTISVGIKQTCKDYIDAYKNEIPMYEDVCAITENYDVKVDFYQMVGGFIQARDPDVYRGIFNKKPHEFVALAKELTEDDVKMMKEFYSDFYRMFNLSRWDMKKRPDCIKSTGFSVMWYIWYHNKDRLGRKTVIERVRKKVAGTLAFSDLAKTGGIGTSKRALSTIVDEMLNFKAGNELFYHR